MIVQAATPDERAWLAQCVGCHLTPAARAIVAVRADGRPAGGVLYDGWTTNSVQCHMAVETPLAWRSLLEPAFRYPFEEAGRNLLLGMIAATNTKSLAMARHLGFEETHRIREGLRPGVDLVLVEMRREQCRWLSNNRRVA